VSGGGEPESCAPAALIAETFAEVPATLFRELRARHAPAAPNPRSVERVVSAARKEIAALSGRLAALLRGQDRGGDPGRRRRDRRHSPP
jgi:hypothetical protein